MRILLSAILLPLVALVLWNIGSLVRRLAKAPQGRWPVSIGIGIAALVFVGGVLNLAHMAYRPVVWCLIAAAVVLAVAGVRRIGFPALRLTDKSPAARVELLLAGAIIAAMMFFTIATQLPPREYNFRDDLQKYFAHPVRMLETGTLHGSPLSALGSETLGGQACLQGILVSLAPLRYINGADAVFGLFALLLLASAAGWRRFGWFPGAAIGALLICLIDPIYANISGLYLPAALMATATLLVADEQEQASPLLLGLVYAAMVAIKPTFLVFLGFHVVFAAFAIGSRRQSAIDAAKWLGRITAASAAFLAPWIILFLPDYLSRGAFLQQAHVVPGDSADIRLFSISNMLFLDNNNVASYSAVAGLALFVGALALIAWLVDWKKHASAGKPLGIFAGCAAGVASYLFMVLYFSRWGGYQSCVRYSVPFLLGSCVIASLMAPALLETLSRAACVVLPSVAAIAVAALFVHSVPHRYHQAVTYGSILEFGQLATRSDYEPYIQSSLSDTACLQIARFQDSVPAGEPIMAWIDTPYWLDYRRNSVIDVDTAGTATPWAHVPGNVRYVFWQFGGYAVRTDKDYILFMNDPAAGARERMIASRAYSLAKVITELANHAEVVASDKQFVVFKLPASAIAGPSQN